MVLLCSASQCMKRRQSAISCPIRSLVSLGVASASPVLRRIYIADGRLAREQGKQPQMGQRLSPVVRPAVRRGGQEDATHVAVWRGYARGSKDSVEIEVKLTPARRRPCWHGTLDPDKDLLGIEEMMTEADTRGS